MSELALRSNGPVDVTEEPVLRPNVDYDSIAATVPQYGEIQVEPSVHDPLSKSLTLRFGASLMHIAALAAPRSTGYWEELQEEITNQTVASGGHILRQDGPFGTELRKVAVLGTEQGKKSYMPSRIWGVQGLRWLLRADIYGSAALAESNSGNRDLMIFHDFFRSVIVRRGDEALAPGSVLPVQKV